MSDYRAISCHLIFTLACRLEAVGDGPGAYHTPGSHEADAEFEWVSPDESARIPYSRDWAELLLLAAEYDLCLTGGLLGLFKSEKTAAMPPRKWY
jgi:hypothetical protein